MRNTEIETIDWKLGINNIPNSYTNPDYLGMIMRDHYNTEMPPVCYMFVGLPCSGKSTFYDTQHLYGYFKYSTDAELERIAEREGLTYNQVFSTHFKEAEKAANANLDNAIHNFRNIVWDQTCVTVNSRASKLRCLSSKYMRVAVVFHCPWEQILIRNENRPGKIIPIDVLKSMERKFENPTINEGFDSVFHIDGTKIL